MIDCTIQIGAAGAVSSFTGTLVSSVTKTATGTYKITLSDNYMKVLAASGMMQSAPSTLSSVASIEMQNAPNAAISPLTAPSVTIRTLDTGGAPVSPTPSSAVNVIILASNSSVTLPNE
jgi:hypothetical protein